MKKSVHCSERNTVNRANCVREIAGKTKEISKTPSKTVHKLLQSFFGSTQNSNELQTLTNFSETCKHSPTETNKTLDKIQL
jgi:hypothetical protein